MCPVQTVTYVSSRSSIIYAECALRESAECPLIVRVLSSLRPSHRILIRVSVFHYWLASSEPNVNRKSHERYDRYCFQRRISGMPPMNFMAYRCRWYGAQKANWRYGR